MRAFAPISIHNNLVAAGNCDEVLVQVSYAIGVVEPMGIYVNTYETANVDFNDGEIAKKVEKLFDMRPVAIERRLKLRTPIYSETAAYGHMGRASEIKTITFKSGNQEIKHKVETFTWEKLDYVKKVKEAFGL
jgi:S-adenosylmethionine synthetase